MLLKRQIVICLLLIVGSWVHVGCQGELIELGEREIFTMESDFTGYEYRVEVKLPVNASNDHSYRTLYLLDSDWYFRTAVKRAAELSAETAQSNFIIIGIDTRNTRTDDFTPTATSQGEGGADAFQMFLEEELIPHIESHYPVKTPSSTRALLGHSLGGLFTVYTFVKSNNLYGTYLALSPSVWYDEAVLLHMEKKYREQNKDSQAVIFTSIAELEPTQLFMKDFADRLFEYYPHLIIQAYLVKGKNHSSAADEAISRSLEFYFESL
jgi:uncharacterized protein